MLAAFEDALGVPADSLPEIAFCRCQLWGAALPLNSPKVECVFDASTRVGVCGDWLHGGSMQAAATSGIALARQIAGLRGRDPTHVEDLNMGLNASFVPLSATDIGEFPAQGTQIARPVAAAV